ncbi:MAG: hypothetical protein ACKVZJ_00385 [Phycisphaerales bacterium]
MSHSHDHHGHHTKAEFEAELTHHDDWFRHSPGERHQQVHGETNPWAIGGTLVLTVLLTFGIAFYVLNYFNRTVAAQKMEKREARTDTSWNADYRKLKSDWNAELSQYRVIDPKAGTVSVPLEAAMDKVVAEYQGKAAK